MASAAAALVPGHAAAADTDTAEEPRDAAASEPGGGPPPLVAPAAGSWFVTPTIEYTRLSGRDADAGLGGFFDQYRFVPNKGSAAPFELGIREAGLALFAADGTPLLHAHLTSPTANLGVSGADIDDPFFAQRLDVEARVGRLRAEIDYWRIRTEELRRFPNTAGAGLLFDDRSRADDRFYRDRTGFLARTHLRVPEGPGGLREWSLHGGYDARDGLRQLRLHRDPSGSWLGIAQPFERSVSRYGTSAIATPARRLTLVADFDYQRLRFEPPTITEADLGFAGTGATRAIGFTPGSDRFTGALRLDTPLGERGSLQAAARFDQLEEAGRRTPDQRATGFGTNRLRHYALDASARWQLSRDWTLRGSFDLDHRDKDLDRDSPLFDPARFTRLAPLLESWTRFSLATELERRLGRAGRLGRASLSLRYDDRDRDLDFVAPASGTPRLLPENTHVAERSQRVSLEGRVLARLAPRLRLDARLGYRVAQQTGYVVDPSSEVFGTLRGSWTSTGPRPVVLTGFVRGSSGSNDDFRLVSGAGPDPAGPSLRREYERDRFGWGLTASLAPTDALALFTSITMQRDDQDAGLDASSLQRYFQDFGPFVFRDAGTTRFRDEQIGWTTGARLRIDARTSARAAYTLTRVLADYRDATTPETARIAASQRYDALIHGVDLRLDRQVREGLGAFVGYRLQAFDDRSPRFESATSARSPFDGSADRHTLTLGVTVSAALFEG